MHFGPNNALNPEMLGNVVFLKNEATGSADKAQQIGWKMPILSIGSLFRPHSKKHPLSTHTPGFGSPDCFVLRSPPVCRKIHTLVALNRGF